MSKAIEALARIIFRTLSEEQGDSLFLAIMGAYTEALADQS